jgi:hypothetical protein
MTLHPADGATASSLRFQPANVELINSVMRRPELYHDLVRKHVTSQISAFEGPTSIHDETLAKASHLDSLLRYDRYARHCFRSYVFPSSKTWKDFEFLGLAENETFAHGAWQATTLRGPGAVIEFRNATEISVNGCEMRVDALKTLTSRVSGSTWNLECRSLLNTSLPCPSGMALGVELVLNFLAPDAHDRYFLSRDVRHPLQFRGELGSAQVTVVDEWQRVKVTLEARPDASWWILPIETISQSELGFERVYQGSAIMAVWKIDPLSWRNVNCVLEMEIAPWESTNDTGK